MKKKMIKEKVALERVVDHHGLVSTDYAGHVKAVHVRTALRSYRFLRPSILSILSMNIC